MSNTPAWMLYGAAGFTGTLIAQHAHERGHRPVLAGRSAPALSALAEKLALPHMTVGSDDPAALRAALARVDLVLNAAGPFLHTASPLVEACLDTGAHYLDISNELQVFRVLYGLDRRARQADVVVIPGVGFGVVATNCLARVVSAAVGGAKHLEVAALGATAQPGPGVAATREQNLPFGGWIRREGRLHPCELGEGITKIMLPNGPAEAMPVPTGDLEAAFEATDAPNIVANTILPASVVESGAQELDVEPQTYESFGWARATNSRGATAEGWLQTGDSYVFTAEASILAVERVLDSSRRGAISPATAFGDDFALAVPNTSRTGPVPLS